MFKFEFGENQESFAVSNDLKSVFRLTQMNGLESSTNSYFLDERVIFGKPNYFIYNLVEYLDGKMIGMVPFLPGWFFKPVRTIKVSTFSFPWKMS